MHRRLVTLMLACLAAPAVAFDGQFSGELKLASDYLFRGIDRTDGPALQGELDYLAQGGAYAGVWASNAGAVGGSEVDTFAGYGRTITVHDLYPVRVDAGVVGYLFTGDEQSSAGRHKLDFAEAFAGARLGPASLKLLISPSYANTGAVAAAIRGALHWPLIGALKLSVEAGVNVGEGVREYTARVTQGGRGRNYLDYSTLLEYALPADFEVAAGVVGTTLDLGDGHDRNGSQPHYLIELGKHFDF